MKTKLYKILGVALTLVLMASLTVGLATAPAGAADPSGNLKWAKLDLPLVEVWNNEATFADSEGDFWCTPDADVGPIAMSPEGDVLLAAVNPDGTTFPSCELLKSLDDGYSWTVTGFFDEAFTANGDGTVVVDIVTSPEYGDDTIVCVATEDYVYISDDGGDNFVQLDAPWGGDITDLDVTVADDGDLVIMVSTDNGEVWVKKGLLGWQDQLIDVSFNAMYGFAPSSVLAANFLPTFADDGNIGICAIATDAGSITTIMSFTFNDINDGDGWGISGIANAPFTNADGIAFYSELARVAFPDDFDAFGIGNNVCFAGVVEDGDLGATGLTALSGSDAYKVVLKEAGTSSATDLDVRGVVTTLLPTATAVTSIDVCGNAEDATILVGTDVCDVTDTPEYFLTYHSEDSGDSWMFSFKQPTGGGEFITDLVYTDAMTQVLMAPDFCNTGMAYAATCDLGGPIGTSAFQQTTDGAASWNQISLIDYGWPLDAYYVTDYGFLPWGYTVDGTIFMITTDTPTNVPAQPGSTNGAVWKRTGGEHLERVFSYANVGVTDGLFMLAAPMDGSAIFAVDLDFLATGNNCMWRTTDEGATWPKKINTKAGLTWVSPLSATTLYTAHDASQANNSGIWWTTKSGTGWSSPDDSEIPNTAFVATVTAVDENIITCGTFDGEVFISSDGGENVEKVGKNNPAAPGPLLETTDLGFADNGIMYATTAGATDVGIWRTSVELDDPGACTWQQIDDNQESDGAVYYDNTTVTPGGPAIALPIADVLYVIDLTPVNTDMTPPTNLAGGLWRSTNPTDDLDSVGPPYFEKENKGLNNGDMLGLLSLDLAMPSFAPTFFCVNYTAANYWEQVVIFTDILNVGVPLAMPEADATGVGLLPEGYVYPEVTIAWQEMAGATSYQYEIGIDPDFKTVIPPGCGFTNSLAVGGIQLDPNMTYYWHVRVAAEGSLIGAPLISPWSETWKFKTAIGASMARPDLQAPWPGEPDVPLSPTFEWSGIEWAEVYEYELALDPATSAGGYFAEPLVALVGTNSLVSTAWKCDIALDYETRYYWHVKAIGVDTDTPWSDVGTFTTMGVPPEVPPPTEGITIPPVQQITPAWIWAIVIIGAILVIAVIVLIVTTRRVP